MPLAIQPDVALAPLTTLGLGGPARRFVRVTTTRELGLALAEAEEAGEPVLVLGGGSNLVVGDAGWPGLVIQIALDGVEIDARDDHAVVTAYAGVPWDDLVARMVEAELAGVECLSGIPGLVGATPMQNVGAYGQEVSDTIVDVDAYDRERGVQVTIDGADCGFGYRTSKFRGSARWIITRVRFRLHRSADSRPIRYAELARALAIAEGETAPLPAVRDRVIALRRGKGMVVDPADPASRSAGSFFVNPVVDAVTLAAVEARLAAGVTMPRFPAAAGMTKLSAGWLIEHAGFTRGTTRGRVGISSKHALALVNLGDASTGELLALVREIQDAVDRRFGIALRPEPVIVGVVGHER
jgi:UDP-N-acetylmuramate dehydrogenase